MWHAASCGRASAGATRFPGEADGVVVRAGERVVISARSAGRRLTLGAGLLAGLTAALLGHPWLGAGVTAGISATAYGLSAVPHRLLYLAIFLMPLDLYRVELPVPLSLYRLVLVVLAVSVGFRLLLLRRAVRRGALHGFVALFLVSTLMAFIRADDLAQGSGVLLNITAGITLVLVSYHVLDSRRRLRRAAFWLLASHLITLLFAVFTWGQFALLGVVVGQLPLAGILPVPLADPGHLATETVAAGFPRLALPYTSPPALSLALAISILIGFGFRLFGTAGTRRDGQPSVPALSLAVLLVLLLGTISRSGWIAFVAGLVWMVVVQQRVQLRHIAYAALGASLLAVVVAVLFPTEAITDRLQFTEGTRKHLETRLEALSIFGRNLETMLLGVGLNSYQEYSASGGPHSHSPFTTVLAERGVVGWLGFWPLYFYMWFGTWWRSTNEHDESWRSAKSGLSAAMLAILVGSVLYEFILINHAWLAVGFAAAAVGVDRKRDRDFTARR